MNHRLLPAAMSALAVAGLMTGAAAPALAQSGASSSKNILPFKATEKTLPNGLKVIVVPTGFPNLVSLQIPVQTGSRNEVEPGKSGFAHFFEHMMFRGTKQSAGAVSAQVMTKAGARENAYTDRRPHELLHHLRQGRSGRDVELEADRFQNLQYPEAEFKTEARAVLGEYNKNSANPMSEALRGAARSRLHDAHLQAHHDGLPQGHRGHAEPVRVLEGVLRPLVPPREHDHHRRRRRQAERSDAARREVLGQVEARQLQGERSRRSRRRTARSTPTCPGRARRSRTCGAFRNPAFSETNKDNAALDFVSTSGSARPRTSTSASSQHEQKVDGFQRRNTSNVDPELFTIFARVKKPRTRLRARRDSQDDRCSAKASLVSADELADAKSNARYSFVRTLDNTDAIASTLARFVHYNRSYDTINKAYQLYDALTPADLRRGRRSTSSTTPWSSERFEQRTSGEHQHAPEDRVVRLRGDACGRLERNERQAMTPPSKPRDTRRGW